MYIVDERDGLARTSPHRHQLLGQRAGSHFAVDDQVPVDLVCRYNAYRFLVQNVHRWQSATGKKFSATAAATDSHQANVMDRWIAASTRLLVSYVRCMPCHTQYYAIELLSACDCLYARVQSA